MLKKNYLLMAVAINISISFLSHHIIYINGFSQHSIVTLHNNNIGTMKYHSSSSSQILQCPSPPHRSVTNQRAQTPLGSTTAKQEGNTNSNSSPSQQQGAKYNVLYQKVLRASRPSSSSSSQSSTSTTLLLDLLSYLQNVYKLPNDLHMPYEITIPDHEAESNNRAVLVINSPLSSTPYDATLEIEVIGIFPDGTDDLISGPTMAMVAVKKLKDPNSSIIENNSGGVTQGLFEASEKQIVNSLDRGLQDLEEGRIVIPQHDTSSELNDVSQFIDKDDDDDGVDEAIKRIAYKNSIDAATGKQQKDAIQPTKNKPISIERDALGNVIIDSVDTTKLPPKETMTKQVASKKKEKKEPFPKRDERVETPDQPANKTEPNASREEKKNTPQQHDDSEDYAIIMARKQAESLMTTFTAGLTTSSTKGTVAISGGESDFAIRAAKSVAEAARKRKTRKEIENKYNSMKGQESSNTSGVNSSPTKAPVQKKKKAKVQDLSNDEMFQKLQKIANESKATLWEKTIPKGTKAVTGKSSTGKAFPKNDKKSQSNKEKTDDEIQNDILQIARENKQIQEEFKAATDMMPNSEEELSPEELLASVLKFGEEKENEEKPGYGFSEGAIGKAKELLQTETEGTASVNNYDDLDFKDGDSDEMKRRAQEEELRRIFAAGQSAAEERLSQPSISQPESNLANKPLISEEDINELIDADKTVPRNARVLDEELAELEVRMSKSQGEESDGPPQNKVFDVFSGPETYNPNVDPETSVNWPGANPGTRTDVKLAADLSTALKQAQFASAVLSQMREEIDDDGANNNDDSKVRYFVGKKELPLERVTLLRKCVNEAVKAGIIENPEILAIERSRLQMLIDELISQPEERLEEITMNYKDLLLSDNFVNLIRERLYNMAQSDLNAQKNGNEYLVKERHASERAILINLAQIAQALVKEAQALGAELEVSMLEIIRSICEVAMDPSHKTEEETTVALTDAVRDMRPLLDDAFVAYLKYAIAEEEGKLARAGVLDDPEHNRWLFVLKIVQEGVYTELSQGVKRYVDHIWYVLRMKSKVERKELLTKLIDVMPTMDVRPFVKVVNNIVGSLGTTVKGDFTDGVILGEMTNELLQLQRDVSELLPPERINELSKDADAWAASQRQKLLERRNLTRQRLEAARITGHIDPDEVIKKPGVEAERFD